MTVREQYRTLNLDSEQMHYVSENDLGIVFHFLKKHKEIDKTLQIGLGHGALALAVLAVTNKLHIVIDPNQPKVQFAGIKNLKQLRLFDWVDFRDDYSYAVLPKLFEGNVLPDFIILDNDQTLDKMMNDFVNIDLICKKGGYLLIRKSENPNNKTLRQYIAANRLDYTIVETALEDFVLYQKTARDIREEDSFQLFT